MTAVWRFGHPDVDEGVAVTGIQATSTGAIALVDGQEAARQSLLLLLTTRPGERVMRPRYGCPLHDLVFLPAHDTTAGLAIHYVRRAVEEFLPEITLVDVDADIDPQPPARLVVALRYRLSGTAREDRLDVAVPLGEEAGGLESRGGRA